MRRLVRALLILVVVACSAPLHGPRPAVRPVRADEEGARAVTWLQVDPRRPRTLFVGGVTPAQPMSACILASPCAPWVMRSDDAGRTWTDLTPRLAPLLGYATVAVPVALSGDGRALYVALDADISADGSYSDILYSLDRGDHWRSVARDTHLLPGSGNEGVGYLTLDPLSPRRLYAIRWSPDSTQLGVSSDGGASWAWRAYPLPFAIDQLAAVGSSPLVADRRRLDTVYANVAGRNGTPGATFLRSDDAGRHWATVRAPTRGLLAGFTIVADWHEGTLLVGQPEDGPRIDATCRPMRAGHGARRAAPATCGGRAPPSPWTMPSAPGHPTPSCATASTASAAPARPRTGR